MNALAVIIPAYKPWFLEAALESLASQTCQDFRVYVGDDASPHELESIVRRFEGRLDLVYRRFEDNLGGKDLVAQWDRCLALSDEPWVWLFSDDDLAGPDCVAAFLADLEAAPDSLAVRRFHTWLIDAEGNRVAENIRTPPCFGTVDFASMVYGAQKLRCSVVEYVFCREVWRERGGFRSFPMAWHSDDATWLRLGRGHGFRTLPAGEVLWRSSGTNISSDRGTDLARLDVDLRFLEAMRQDAAAGDEAAAQVLHSFPDTVWSGVGTFGIGTLLRQNLAVRRPGSGREWTDFVISSVGLSWSRMRYLASLRLKGSMNTKGGR